jgi:23S rRNA A2030 N6-methylase RlmJ
MFAYVLKATLAVSRLTSEPKYRTLSVLGLVVIRPPAILEVEASTITPLLVVMEIKGDAGALASLLILPNSLSHSLH